jgi:cell division protein FtsB
VSRPAWAWDDDGQEEAWEEGAALALLFPEPQPRGPEPLPGGRPLPRVRRRLRVRWGQLAAVGLLAYLGFVGVTSEITLLGVRHEAAALTRQAQALAAGNRVLEREVALLHRRRYVTELARTELGYTSPGEQELVPQQVPAGAVANSP